MEKKLIELSWNIYNLYYTDEEKHNKNQVKNRCITWYRVIEIKLL